MLRVAYLLLWLFAFDCVLVIAFAIGKVSQIVAAVVAVDVAVVLAAVVVVDADGAACCCF